MILGKKILVWFLVIVIIVVCILLTTNFRFLKRAAETIFNEAKSAFSVSKEIDLEENKRAANNYLVYLENKDSNSIFIEWGSEGFNFLNNQQDYSGKSFSLDEGIIIEVNSEFKELDIAEHFKPGDIVKIVYSPFSLYLFIERHDVYGNCTSLKEKIDIFK